MRALPGDASQPPRRARAHRSVGTSAERPSPSPSPPRPTSLPATFTARPAQAADGGMSFINGKCHETPCTSNSRCILHATGHAHTALRGLTAAFGRVCPIPSPSTADSTAAMISMHHKVNLALLGVTPVALMVGQPLQFGADMLLAVALPIHGHIGMNLVITDYAKKVVGKGGIGPSRVGLALITGTTMLGLLKLNLTGPGITETVKSFWRPKA